MDKRYDIGMFLCGLAYTAGDVAELKSANFSQSEGTDSGLGSRSGPPAFYVDLPNLLVVF